MKFREYITESKVKVVDVKELQNKTKNHKYMLDGEEVDIVEFIKANLPEHNPGVDPLPTDDINAIVNMKPSQKLKLGGGAGATFEIQRIK